MSTGISWADETWNPVTGCSHVSPGCENCYAESLSRRFGWTSKPWAANNAAENVKLHPERLDHPRRWKKPRRVFVNSMSDLFHGQVPVSFIDEVFARMAVSERHQFLVLTKRPEMMRRYMADGGAEDRIAAMADDLFAPVSPELQIALGRGRLCDWPLPNVWLGVSVEDQRRAHERIPILLQTPAAVRFVSAEPLLEEVEFFEWLGPERICCRWPEQGADCGELICPGGNGARGIDWVIAGGESGPGYRPCDLDWLRSIRDQCQVNETPVWIKQPAGPRSEMTLPDDLQIRELPR